MFANGADATRAFQANSMLVLAGQAIWRLLFFYFRVSSRGAQIRRVPERKWKNQTTTARLRPPLVVASATTATFGCGRRTR